MERGLGGDQRTAVAVVAEIGQQQVVVGGEGGEAEQAVGLAGFGGVYEPGGGSVGAKQLEGWGRRPLLSRQLALRAWASSGVTRSKVCAPGVDGRGGWVRAETVVWHGWQAKGGLAMAKVRGVLGVLGLAPTQREIRKGREVVARSKVAASGAA